MNVYMKTVLHARVEGNFVTGNLCSSCSFVSCLLLPNTSFNIAHCEKRDTYSPKKFKFKVRVNEP